MLAKKTDDSPGFIRGKGPAPNKEQILFQVSVQISETWAHHVLGEDRIVGVEEGALFRSQFELPFGCSGDPGQSLIGQQQQVDIPIFIQIPDRNDFPDTGDRWQCRGFDDGTETLAFVQGQRQSSLCIDQQQVEIRFHIDISEKHRGELPGEFTDLLGEGRGFGAISLEDDNPVLLCDHQIDQTVLIDVANTEGSSVIKGTEGSLRVGGLTETNTSALFAGDPQARDAIEVGIDEGHGSIRISRVDLVDRFFPELTAGFWGGSGSRQFRLSPIPDRFRDLSLFRVLRAVGPALTTFFQCLEGGEGFVGFFNAAGSTPHQLQVVPRSANGWVQLYRHFEMGQSQFLLAGSQQADGDLVMTVRIPGGELEGLAKFDQCRFLFSLEAANDAEIVGDTGVIRAKAAGLFKIDDGFVDTLFSLIELSHTEVEEGNKTVGGLADQVGQFFFSVLEAVLADQGVTLQMKGSQFGLAGREIHLVPTSARTTDDGEKQYR